MWATGPPSAGAPGLPCQQCKPLYPSAHYSSHYKCPCQTKADVLGWASAVRGASVTAECWRSTHALDAVACSTGIYKQPIPQTEAHVAQRTPPLSDHATLCTLVWPLQADCPCKRGDNCEIAISKPILGLKEHRQALRCLHIRLQALSSARRQQKVTHMANEESRY